MKRFYETVTIDTTQDGAYVLKLDGKPVKTPGQNTLMSFYKPLSDSVRAEWEAQEESINPKTMPLTQLLNTKIDHIDNETNRERMASEAGRFLDSELICYYAEAPQDLVQKQRSHWRPLQEWFEKRAGCALNTVSGIQFAEQDETLKFWGQKTMAAMDPYKFTAFQAALGPVSSFVIALAFVEEEIDLDTAFQAAFIEELYQAEHWGIDEEAEKKRQDALNELREIRNFLDLSTKNAPKR